MDILTVVAVVSCVCTVVGIIIGWLGQADKSKRRVIEEAERSVLLLSDVQHVKKAVDDLSVESRAINRLLIDVDKRVGTVETTLSSVTGEMKELNDRVVVVEKETSSLGKSVAVIKERINLSTEREG